MDGCAGDQEQDLPRDQPDVRQEEQSGDQAGLRGRTSEGQRSGTGGYTKGHCFLEETESIQERRKSPLLCERLSLS